MHWEALSDVMAWSPSVQISKTGPGGTESDTGWRVEGGSSHFPSDSWHVIVCVYIIHNHCVSPVFYLASFFMEDSALQQ